MTAPPQREGTKESLLLSIALIAAISFAVYFNALFNGFVYDDSQQVLLNPWIRDLRNLPEIFAKSVWSFMEKVGADAVTSNYYRPLMHVTYMADFYLFGLRPWGFHLVNILFHMGNSVLVFLLISRLLDARPKKEGKGQGAESIKQVTGDELSAISKKNQSFTPSPPSFLTTHCSLFSPHASRFAFHDSRSSALIGALLFATHPIHTEAVTWIAALPEVAYTFFYLLSFYFYMRYREEQSAKSSVQSSSGGLLRSLCPMTYAFYALSLASFSVSVLFKEPALTLPILLIAYDHALRNDRMTLTSGIRRYSAFFIAAGIYLLLRFSALGGFAPEKRFLNLSGYEYVLNMFPLFAGYLWKVLLPINLTAFHVFHPLTSIGQAKSILSLSASAAFMAGLLIAMKKDGRVFLGFLFFAVPLLPVLYIPALGENTFTERYLYLPSAGFVLLIALCLLWLQRKVPQFFGPALCIVIALAAFYSFQTMARNAIWKTEIVLFADTVKKSPDAPLMRNNYGSALDSNGQLDEAIEQFQAALKLRPDYWEAQMNLGIAYGKKGRLDKAVEHLDTALRLNPRSASVRANLGNAYALMGYTDMAIEQFLATLQLDPGLFEAHVNLASSYNKKGLLDKEIEEYEAAIQLRPDFEEGHYLLGRAYANAGRLDNAIERLRYATGLSPDNASYHNTLGVFYAQKGLFDEAVGQFEEAVRLAPDNPSYRQNLERALGQKK